MSMNQQMQELGQAAGSTMARGDGEERSHSEPGAAMSSGQSTALGQPGSGTTQERRFPLRAPERTTSTQRRKAASHGNVGERERAISMLMGGTLMALAMRQRSAGLALAGAGLLHRGATGHCYAYQALGIDTAQDEQHRATSEYAAHVERSMTIGRPAHELYALWREPQNLRKIMEHFAEVSATGESTAHWKMPLPVGGSIEWDTRIVEERPGEMIRWESLPGTSMPNEGRLQFRPATGNRGTIATLRMRFNAPGGALGTWAAKAMRIVPSTVLMRTLHRFKNIAETGEIASSARDTSGRRSATADAAQKRPVMGLARGLGWFSLALGAAELFAPRSLAHAIGAPASTGLIRFCGLREMAAGFGVLSMRKPQFWMWSRVTGDAMDLALLAAATQSPQAQPAKLAAATTAVIGVTAADVWTALGFGRRSQTGISNWEQSGLLHRR
jgi:uncharacterized membrane protein